MAELFTREEVAEFMRSEVEAAGGAKKWLRKNKIMRDWNHALHMVANGTAAFADGEILRKLKFRQVTRYEGVSDQGVTR